MTICAAGLEWRVEKAVGEYRVYYGGRARRCRSWLEDLKEGHRIGDADIRLGRMRRAGALGVAGTAKKRPPLGGRPFSSTGLLGAIDASQVLHLCKIKYIQE